MTFLNALKYLPHVISIVVISILLVIALGQKGALKIKDEKIYSLELRVKNLDSHLIQEKNACDAKIFNAINAAEHAMAVEDIQNIIKDENTTLEVVKPGEYELWED